jgi:N-acetylmuramoyl-L-alanine amidase
VTDHRGLTRGPRARLGLALATAAVGGLATACGGGVAASSSPAVSSAAARPPVAAVQAAAAGPAVASGSQAKPLAGKVVGIDPGHNGRNGSDPAYLNHLIWNGREWEACDTTGTQTNGGYTEARFNFNVATYLRRYLQQDGARVVLTRHNNHGVGPCVNRRSRIINHAHANVAIDIHADGGPSWGRGFTVLEPVADGPNNKVIKSSERFGRDVRSAFLRYTTMPVSDYYGHDGIIFRDDLAGLNLTTVPKVLIETGNMRNATDARLLTSARFQREIARALEAAIIRFLR